jgi:hypothetical protein
VVAAKKKPKMPLKDVALVAGAQKKLKQSKIIF